MKDTELVDCVVIPANIWKQVEQTAKECQRCWGMGFPVISITLLKKILKKQPINKIGRSIEKEQV